MWETFLAFLAPGGCDENLLLLQFKTLVDWVIIPLPFFPGRNKEFEKSNKNFIRIQRNSKFISFRLSSKKIPAKLFHSIEFYYNCKLL